MLKNYIKVAFRNLLQNKVFSLINILGLAIGMSCSILIMLWVQDELSFDRFHDRSENMYRVTASLEELDVHAAVSSAPLGPAFKAEVPEVKSAVRITGQRSELMQVDDKVFEEKGMIFADSNFLEFFSFPLVEGDPKTALLQPEGILITQEIAKKYFGGQSALGKTIKKNHKDDFTVTGVLANIPENSHLKFDFVQPMMYLAKFERDLKDNVWDNFNYYTYVELDEHLTPTKEALGRIEKRFQEIYKANEPGLKVSFSLQPLSKIHLYSNLMADLPGHGDVQYVYIFIVVGVFILAVACINFMNLATARSARRAKEVGLRKVAGAVRFQLIRQFLAESSLVALIALVLAVLIVAVALPYFNDLAGKSLSVNFLNAKLVFGLLAITVATGILAGSYPALFLSGFVPAKVLKGNLKSGAGSSLFRNAMVVIQFTVSITLLVGTAVIYNQLQFIRSRNPGYNKENLVYVRMTGETWKNYKALRGKLEGSTLCSEFGAISDLPTDLTNATISVEWDGKDPNSQPLFANLQVDENFVDVFKPTILKGRGFSKEFRSDTAAYMVNEEALKIMGMTIDNAVGQKMTMWGTKGDIIGVVKNFNFKPVQKAIEPLILKLNTWGGIIVVRTKPQQSEATIKEMEKIFKEINPEYPFSYSFLDQDIDNMYKAEHTLSSLFTVFAGLAIFISCLGLYGLSAFLAERRTKEIGVRKVLGASDFHVVYLLSKTFTKPILIAMVIAVPLGWYTMSAWLDGFAFHVGIDWTIFVIAFASSLLIAWLTVSYESIKAAIANPAESLRNE